MNNENSIEDFLAQRTASSGLGIDIGRVIMCPARDDGQPDTSFLTADDAAALETPAAPGMFEVVPRLVDAFGGRVWLVSKAGARIETLTRRWFVHHQFFARTGLSEDQARFCRRREDKRVHAAELGLTHFIDDRTDVLTHLRGLVPHLGLFGPASATSRLDGPGRRLVRGRTRPHSGKRMNAAGTASVSQTPLGARRKT